MKSKTSHSIPNTGRLFLIPSALSEGALLEVLPLHVKKKVEEIDDYIAENEKTARHFIKRLVPSKLQPKLNFYVLNKFTRTQELSSFLEPCKNGRDMGLLSEAGCPGIADPGAQIVQRAHENGIRVIPLVGPSSVTLAMMASGLNGQHFSFHGYLPIEKKKRKNVIKDLERQSAQENQAQLFIETPYRNEKLFRDLIKYLQPTTSLCIARGITSTDEFILTKPIKEWQKIKVNLHKKPTIFIVQKGL